MWVGNLTCSYPCLYIAGYNYFGNERMYSGVSGREFEADIFFGVVYYQRLRHMVSDKFQVFVYTYVYKWPFYVYAEVANFLLYTGHGLLL